MKRKSIFWASISLAIILAYSCRLPSAVQINVDDFELSVGLGVEVGFSEMFRGILEDAFDGGDTSIRIFDMVDEGPAITFLVAFELEEMLPSFNPSDYLAAFADHNADGISPIAVNIPVPDLSWSCGGIEIPLSVLVPGIPPSALAGTRQVVPLPPQVVEAISAASDAWALSGGFLNADVGFGTFGLRATVLTAGPSHPLNVSGRITVSQAPASLKDGSGSFYGLVASESWGFTEGNPHNLHGSSLNRNPIIVHSGISESFLDIEFDGVYLSGNETIRINMVLDIGIFDVVRLDSQNNEDLAISPIKVNFAAMHGRSMSIADFIKEITFRETKMELEVSRLHSALDGRVKLAVTSEQLGFSDEPNLLTSQGATFTGKNAPPLVFDHIRPSHDEDIEAILEIYIKLVPLTGNFFEFGPINLAGNGGLYINATVGLGFDWYSAIIDTSLMDPDELLGGSILDEPINLGDTFGDLMSGFAFAPGSIEVSIFLDGALGILEADAKPPMLTLNAVFDEYGTSRVPLFENRPLTDAMGTIPTLPSLSSEWRYGLPDYGINADMVRFIDEIGDGFPEYLRLSYEVTFDDPIISIFYYMFDDDEDDEVRIMVMMKLALDFEASAGAYFNLPLFEDNENDIFDRDRVGDPLFGNESMDIRMLMLRLEFDESIFQGARLHLDANGNLFPDGMALNDGINGNLEIRIGGNDFDIINRHLIPPNVRIVYPQERNLRITRDLIPTRIAIAVSGSYTLEL